MKMKNRAFALVIVLLTIFCFCAVSHGEEYKETDLPFNVVDLMIEKGGNYSEKVENDGVRLSCSGISLKALKLGDHEIPLKSTAVTSDCLIKTKNYGNLQIKISFVRHSYSIFVTPKQEKQLKKLALMKQ